MRFTKNVGSLEYPRYRGICRGVWKSPELLVVMDSEKFNDWQQLDDSYLNGWSVSFPSSKQSVVENSAMILQRFTDGWKIVASHTSIVEM